MSLQEVFSTTGSLVQINQKFVASSRKLLQAVANCCVTVALVANARDPVQTSRTANY